MIKQVSNGPDCYVKGEEVIHKKNGPALKKCRTCTERVYIYIYRRRNLRSGLRKMQSISHMIFYGQKLLFFHIWTFINFYLWTSAFLGHFVKVTKLEKWGKSPLFLNKVQNHTFFKFLKIILNVVILTPNLVDILYTPLTFV